MKKLKVILVTFVMFVFFMSGTIFIAAADIPNETLTAARATMRDMGSGDAYNSYIASDNAMTLTTPISGTGSIYYSSDQYDQYKVAVSAGEQVTIGFTEPSGANGIDFYVYDTDKSRIALLNNVASISETYTASGNGYIYFCVDADTTADRGTYSLSVTKSGGGGGGDDGGELTDGVTAYGHMNSADGADMWYIDVGANAESMYVVLTCGSADFDTYGRFGSEPTTSVYDWRGYTSGGEENTVNSPQQGRHYIMVDYWSGDADYQLTATITYGTVDTEDPSVSVTNPANGATVSGTVSVTASASDNVGVTQVRFYIDGSLKTTDTSSPYSYSWDTTGYADGSHTVQAVAYDAAGNSASDTNTVTVSNGGGGDDGGALTDGVAASGHMDQADGADMWYIDVGANAQSMYVVLTCGSSDFDTYGRFGAEPTTSVYDWRGYTGGGEENTVTSPQEGRHYIMVDWYSGDDDYTLTVTITYGGGGGGSWGTGGKYAIVIGISDYQSIGDLSYCDEDATDWYNFLTGKGYEVHVYGDNHPSNYPRYDGLATEANVRAAIQELAAHAQSGDKVVITTSGHGGADETNGWYYSGGGATNDVTNFLCMYDSSSGSTGNYYESEITADLSGLASGVKFTMVVDHCHSGGAIPEVQALSNSGDILYLTTCTGNGYGYDEPTYSNGKFTYWLLQAFSNGQTTWEDAFDWILVSGRYLPVDNAADTPQEFDGNTGVDYTP